jgi:hypothetical protein
MNTQPDPVNVLLAYGSIALLVLLGLSILSGKISAWWAARHTPMSSYQPTVQRLGYPDPPQTTTATMEPQGIAIDDNERNALLFAGKSDALAAMVHAGKIGETEGIKIVYGVGPSSTNKTYQAAREMLKARLARLQPEKFRLSPEQEAAREALGLHSR